MYTCYFLIWKNTSEILIANVKVVIQACLPQRRGRALIEGEILWYAFMKVCYENKVLCHFPMKYGLNDRENTLKPIFIHILNETIFFFLNT